MTSKKTNSKNNFLKLLVGLEMALMMVGCQKAPLSSIAINEPTLSPVATSTEESIQTPNPTPDALVSATLQESKHNRDEIVPRIFNTLSAESNQATVTFEVSKTTDQSEIDEIYKTMINTIEHILDRFPIKTAEKPEFIVLERDGSGKLLEHPQFYGNLTLIPYSAIESGQILEIIIKGIAYESEPWVAYGLVGIISDDQVEVDLDLIQDTNKLFLTGISYEVEYVTDDDLVASKALAGAFMQYILANYGEDVLMELIEKYSLQDKVTYLNRFISEEEKVTLFEKALAGIYVPFDEDSYGYVTLEGFQAGKAMISCKDAGGTDVVVKDGETGYMTDSTPEAIAEAMDKMYLNKPKTIEMGLNGLPLLEKLGITWDNVIRRLTE